MLRGSGGGTEVRDNKGRRPLFYASGAYSSGSALAKVLILVGANREVIDKGNNTRLHFWARY